MSIFVGNLPFRAEREDVLELFSPFGEVTNCSLPLERDTGRKRGFAFVEMADESTELSVIESLQGTEMMGRPLRINKAEPRTNYPRRNNNYNSRVSNNTGGYGSNNTGGYGSNNTGGYGSNNTGGYGSNNTGGYGSNNTGGYGSNNSYNDQNSTSESRSSGTSGWEDRSYGNSTENAEFENSRSRRKRSASNSSEQQEDS